MGQDIEYLVALLVDEDAARMVRWCARGKAKSSTLSTRGVVGQGSTYAQMREQGIVAHRDTLPLEQPRSWLAAQREGHLQEPVTQAIRAMSVRSCHTRQLLGEDAARTAKGVTETSAGSPVIHGGEECAAAYRRLARSAGTDPFSVRIRWNG
jgi:hypothetical protein